jgi:hypothetical protein
MDLSESREVAVGGPLYLTLRQLVDLIQGALGSAKAKVFVPDMLLPRVAALVPPSARPLFAGSRLAMLEETSVASPGIVEREFGFTPQSVVERIGGYV